MVTGSASPFRRWRERGPHNLRPRRPVPRPARVGSDKMVLVDRVVTLVACTQDGTVLGQLEPFTVGTPWWQDMEPVHGRHPSFPRVAITRRVSAQAGLGGHVRYLAQAPLGRSTGTSLTSLSACDVVLGDHPFRMPWARPGGPAGDVGWASRLVDRSGPVIQHRTWNLSAIWSIPTGMGRVWLKCIPKLFIHEAAVLDLLDSPSVPEVIGAVDDRILLADLGGRDGDGATVEESLRLIDCLVEMQSGTVTRVPEFLAAGVPDARWPVLIPQLRALVARRAPNDAALRQLIDGAEDRVRAIEECGLPNVPVHGDAHPGNARIGVEPPVWFDWGDSRVGNPLLDLAVLERVPGRRHILEQYWLAAWARAAPGSDPAQAWKLLRPLAALRGALVYQGFVDNIEPSERAYHVADVAAALELASAITRAETS